MREIKFRAYDRERKLFIYVTLPQGAIDTAFSGYWPSGSLEPWQQFTGLKDKNRKEIYDGDIVDMYSGTGASEAKRVPLYIVIWKKDCPGFYLSDLKGFSTTNIFAQPYMETAEVVGNVHENSELGSFRISG